MRYLITGGSGYIGSRLVERLARREDTEEIVICDLAAPRFFLPQTEFERVDVRDRDGVRATLERAKPDALVHLAFILNPCRDESHSSCLGVGSGYQDARRIHPGQQGRRPNGRPLPLA